MCPKPKKPADQTPAVLPVTPPNTPAPEKVAQSVKTEDGVVSKTGKRKKSGLEALRVPLSYNQNGGNGLQIGRG